MYQSFSLSSLSLSLQKTSYIWFPSIFNFLQNAIVLNKYGEKEFMMYILLGVYYKKMKNEI